MVKKVRFGLLLLVIFFTTTLIGNGFALADDGGIGGGPLSCTIGPDEILKNLLSPWGFDDGCYQVRISGHLLLEVYSKQVDDGVFYR